MKEAAMTKETHSTATMQEASPEAIQIEDPDGNPIELFEPPPHAL
jgi:catechol-2,3-dioxygenase